jgi:hypothetical protein
MKPILISVFLMTSLVFAAGAPRLGDIPRDPDGSVSFMSEPDADQYCRSQGTRLPTIRELALYAQSLGALGIRETTHIGEVETDSAVQTEIAQMKGDGYEAIFTLNSAGQPTVDFYFSHSGYRAPPGDLGAFWLYSSSVAALSPTDNYTLSSTNGETGHDGRDFIYDDDAGRCILPPAPGPR